MSHSDERRRLPRRRTRLSAAAVHGAEGAVVACTVRDKSDRGARLLLEPGGSVPDAFQLVELSSGDAHKALVVWRDATFVGVTLHDTRNVLQSPTPDDLHLNAVRLRFTSKPAAR
jgi:hypothetical protein